MSRISTKKLNKIDSSRHLLDGSAPQIVGELVCEIRRLDKDGVEEAKAEIASGEALRQYKRGWKDALQEIQKWHDLPVDETKNSLESLLEYLQREDESE